MKVTVDVPENLAVALGCTATNISGLDRHLLESAVLEGYRRGSLSRHEVQVLLGFDNYWDTTAWLGEHGQHVQYDVTDLEDDRRTLDKLFPAS